VQSKRVWGRVIGVERDVVIEAVEFDEPVGEIVVSCRLRRGAARRCGHCNRRCGRYDQGEGRRRWRALDAGTMKVFIEAEAPRVSCPEHGVTVAAVPWARHGAGHTRTFDDQVAWLVTHCSKSAVVELMRVAWRSVGAIAGRVVTDARAGRDPFDGLVRIGIDEISYRRGHRYLMVVVDHDSGRLVWAASGHDRATLQAFFDLLGAERASRIKLISADAAEWIGDCATAACTNATLCLDPFHIVRWASQALDVVRRWAWNVLRHLDLPGHARQLKNCRYALWKNPQHLTTRQATKLAWIARHNHQLYRAYLLNYPALGGGSRGDVGGVVGVEPSEVGFEAGDDALVAGGLGGPAAGFGVVAELADVVELSGDGGGEVGGGDVVGAGLADVGVGAGVGGEVA
jgi:transposase